MQRCFLINESMKRKYTYKLGLSQKLTENSIDLEIKDQSLRLGTGREMCTNFICPADRTCSKKVAVCINFLEPFFFYHYNISFVYQIESRGYRKHL